MQGAPFIGRAQRADADLVEQNFELRNRSHAGYSLKCRPSFAQVPTDSSSMPMREANRRMFTCSATECWQRFGWHQLPWPTALAFPRRS